MNNDHAIAILRDHLICNLRMAAFNQGEIASLSKTAADNVALIPTLSNAGDRRRVAARAKRCQNEAAYLHIIMAQQVQTALVTRAKLAELTAVAA